MTSWLLKRVARGVAQKIETALKAAEKATLPIMQSAYDALMTPGRWALVARVD